MSFTPTRERANGKWHEILPMLGVPATSLTGKHGPCPMCGGKDRFRFINSNGNGTYVCNQCGGGDALDLLMAVSGQDFRTCAVNVDKISGNVKMKEPKKRLSNERRLELLDELYRQSSPATHVDLVGIYLQARGFDWIPEDIMFCRAARAPNGTTHPAMIAMVRNIKGEPCTLHRTFLGRGVKADMENPRAMMPGSIPDGACIRLGALKKHIGIAEGIETAMAAQKRFGVVTWAASNSAMLQKWKAPEGVERVTIFGDCDAKYGGQASAYALAHKLAVSGLAVRVEIPDKFGTDWADL